MSSATFPNPKASNVHTTTVKLPDREQQILREAYESMGEPEPENGVTLSHNSAFGDFCRAIIRGDVSPEDVTASEPEEVSDSKYLPLELSVTQEEAAGLDAHGIETTVPTKAYRRNGHLAQQIRAMLKHFCEDCQ